jgi:hypothetical protein
VYAVRQQAADVFAAYRIAGLMGSLVDLKSSPAIFKHLRHEWQPLKTAVLVERRKYLFLASDFDPIASAQCHDDLPLSFLLTFTQMIRHFCRTLPYDRDEID